MNKKRKKRKVYEPFSQQEKRRAKERRITFLVMRTRKSSSNDSHGEVYKYLSGIPDNQRVKLDGKIIRKGKILNGGHTEVMLIVEGKIVHHKFQ